MILIESSIDSRQYYSHLRRGGVNGSRSEGARAAQPPEILPSTCGMRQDTRRIPRQGAPGGRTVCRRASSSAGLPGVGTPRPAGPLSAGAASRAPGAERQWQPRARGPGLAARGGRVVVSQERGQAKAQHRGGGRRERLSIARERARGGFEPRALRRQTSARVAMISFSG